ncbi:hypothetical protein IWW39_003797 [Coemansia spiralis]|uniref:Uncharacterized protein n=1 Tax=Coemansia spiralis TaxID=417178 RepID=A0A9W8GHV9_9FUNG|nr:hypothetical protein GGI06_002906 [Coemansia sp. S85]KAJ2686186.1 hypothetical protein IWW39_003797 [Coemansia spiralis]
MSAQGDDMSYFDDPAEFRGKTVWPSRESILIVVFDDVNEMDQRAIPIGKDMDLLEIDAIETYIQLELRTMARALNFASGLEAFDENTGSRFTEPLADYTENPLKVRFYGHKYYYCIAIRTR